MGGADGGSSGGCGGDAGGEGGPYTYTSRKLRMRLLPGSLMRMYCASPTHCNMNGPPPMPEPVTQSYDAPVPLLAHRSSAPAEDLRQTSWYPSLLSQPESSRL